MMSIVDHTFSVDFPYSLEDVRSAIEFRMQHSAEYSVDRFDSVTNTYYLKTGISLFSWGENISITLTKQANGHTNASFLSTPKTGAMFGGALDMGWPSPL